MFDKEKSFQVIALTVEDEKIKNPRTTDGIIKYLNNLIFIAIKISKIHDNKIVFKS